jgi:hypothetical protein
MDAGAVLALAAAQPLAVNRHMAGAAGRHRAAQRPFQIGRRNRPENIMVSGMTGRPAAADPECGQTFRRKPATPAENRHQIVGARQHRRQRNPDDCRQGIAPPLQRPLIWQRFKPVPQPIHRFLQALLTSEELNAARPSRR